MPDIQLGPVGEGKDANALALRLSPIEEVPQFRALVPWVPAMGRGAEREDAFLGPALLLIATRAAEGDVEPVLVERLFQPLGLPHIGVQRAMVERIDAARRRVRIGVDDQIHAAFGRRAVTQRIHVAELPGRIDVEKGERWRRGIEGLAREVQHHRAVLAHGIEHHRALGLRHHLAHDVDALGLEPFQMGEGYCRHRISSAPLRNLLEAQSRASDSRDRTSPGSRSIPKTRARVILRSPLLDPSPASGLRRE